VNAKLDRLRQQLPSRAASLNIEKHQRNEQECPRKAPEVDHEIV
jgi:hypothetical protein